MSQDRKVPGASLSSMGAFCHVYILYSQTVVCYNIIIIQCWVSIMKMQLVYLFLIKEHV